MALQRIRSSLETGVLILLRPIRCVRLPRSRTFFLGTIFLGRSFKGMFAPRQIPASGNRNAFLVPVLHIPAEALIFAALFADISPRDGVVRAEESAGGRELRRIYMENRYEVMMKNIFAAAALLSMIACGGSHDLPLEGTTWKLVRMQGIPDTAIESEEDAFTLSFDAADTLVAGRTNCNRFFGRYEVEKDRLHFGQMGMTRMACPDMEYEDAFTEMLGDADRFAIEGAELTLYDDRKPLAVFRAVSESEK